jgi:hypothetical protein
MIEFLNTSEIFLQFMSMLQYYRIWLN